MEDTLNEEVLPKEDRAKFYYLCQKHDINNIIPSLEVISAIELLERVDPRILHDIAKELIDNKFPGITHGRRSTYSNLGCRGRLCRYANTLDMRQRKGIDKKMRSGIDEALVAIIKGHQRGME